jgi:DNA-binding NtrC family response regulator
MQTLRAAIESASRSHAKVLLTGETGVGKEVVARAIHDQSGRQTQPFITINCAGVPDSLLESELFGHMRGSFTDAYRDQPGLLRQAHGGTVFLDEVGETSLRMQALLLRFLETGEIQTVGGGASRAPVDVRVITATNRNLAEAVSARDFREDLYYRLNVLHLHIPPLRERGPDIELLLEYYLAMFTEQHGTSALGFSRAALDTLMGYPWPGNVRELRNVVERLALHVTASTIEPSHLPREILAAATEERDTADRSSVSHEQRINIALDRLLNRKESFWTVVYPMFMARDMTRDDLRFIVRTGLEHTRGSYRMLLELFNMGADEYKKFLSFLRQHDCHLPFQRFRMLNLGPSSGVNRPPTATNS